MKILLLTRVIFFTFIISLPQAVLGSDWLFGPKNSQECIQKYQKTAKSKLAARVIHIACNNKFNLKTDKKYSDCLLDHVGNTKSDIAIRAIIGACSNLYKEGINKEFSKCILKNMPGVEVDMSARSIVSSCNCNQ
jgi:hypothetical protein